MRQRRRFTRVLDGGSVPLGGTEYRVQFKVTAFVVSPADLEGTVTLWNPNYKVDHGPYGDLKNEARTLRYAYSNVESLVERYKDARASLALLGAEVAVQHGLNLVASEIEVVRDVLVLYGDVGSWRYRANYNPFEPTVPPYLAATLEETDAAIAHLREQIGKIKSLPSPTIHPTDYEDEREELEREAERRRKELAEPQRQPEPERRPEPKRMEDEYPEDDGLDHEEGDDGDLY